MRKPFLVAGLATLALGTTGVAVAQTPAPTIDASATLSPSKAGTKSKPKAQKLKLVVKNNVESKATASTIKVTFPSTLKVSTSGLPQCTKSDTEIINSLAAVCKRSAAGSGEANAQLVSTGAPIDFNVTPIVGKGELLFYLAQIIKRPGQSPLQGSVRAVLHGKIKGRTMTISIPEFLQEPTDNTFSALLGLDATISKKKGSKALITSTGCKSKKHNIGVTVEFVPNPRPPVSSSSSDTAAAKCS